MSMGIREIAKLAGVSPTTVSFVVNNRDGVSPETRSRIKQLLKENGYAVKRHVKRRGAALPVCVIRYTTQGLNGGFEEASAMIDRVYAELYRYEMKVCVVICYPDTFQNTLASALAGKYSAVAIIGTDLGPRQIRMLDGMDFMGKPVVVLDNTMFCTNVSSVSASYRELSHIAINHLYSLGHREIGYLRSAATLAKYEERLFGFEEAAQSFPFQGQARVCLTPNVARAYEEMKRWLKGNPSLPSAFMADSDAIALGAMKALQENGLRIPEDVSVIGTGNAEFGAISNPPLTTIDIACEQISITGTFYLMRLIDSDGSYENAEHVTVCGKLIERGSTGPASS